MRGQEDALKGTLEGPMRGQDALAFAHPLLTSVACVSSKPSEGETFQKFARTSFFTNPNRA